MKNLFLFAAVFGLAACLETTTGGSGNGTGGTGGEGGVTITPVPCTDCLAAPITWGLDGGMVSWIDSASLTSCRTFTFTRDPGYGEPPGPTQTCSVEIGGCDAPPVAVHEVEQALAHPHVVAALAAPSTPLYGWDSRCTDGSVLVIQVGDKSIEIGTDCETGYGCHPADGNCVPPPAGVLELADVLSIVQTHALQAGDCAGQFP
ncbi:MAG: hypothetical protein IT372_16960 [Polyangiaceae bacterium]|nr:hypothetical protein [Polyangiaceae bacterium]